ncbi:MAG: hypothetical protein LBN93_01780 [Candidatus Symbiothrix sp.]|jgi:hypothetical protein|nr:hypothetical protein [Candidatus Symbiothrix sp.]
MNKKFLLVGMIAMFGFGAFVVSSCSKDDDDSDSGSCKTACGTYSAAEVKALIKVGYSDCADIQEEAKQLYAEYGSDCEVH